MWSNSSLKSFPNQAASYEIILVDMYLVSTVLMATDFCFLLIHYIEAESKEDRIEKCSIDPPNFLPI